MKKLNAALSLLTAVMVCTHTVIEACLMLGLGTFAEPIAYVSIITAVLFAAHVALSLVIFFFFTEHGGFTGVTRYNAATILQRLSALIMLVLIHFHKLTWSLPVMAAIACLHMAVSVPRAFITLGLVVSDGALICTRRICVAACALLFVFLTTAILIYIL